VRRIYPLMLKRAGKTADNSGCTLCHPAIDNTQPHGDNMTEKVLALIETVFPNHERDSVAALLRDDIVGPPRLNERIHLAALHLSGGRLDQLESIMADACIDFKKVIFRAQSLERTCDRPQARPPRLVLRKKGEIVK